MDNMRGKIGRRSFLKGALALGAPLAWPRLAVAASPMESYVRVSPRDSRYFELTDGRPYLAIGGSMAVRQNFTNAGAPVHDPADDDEASGLRLMETLFRKFSGSGGNFVRVFLSHPFFDVEHERSGVYDEAKGRRIKALVELARRYQIRMDLCLEHFRSLNPEYRQPWAARPLHSTERGGPARNTAEFFTNERSREQFKRKLRWFQQHFGSDPAIFAWELWNEINDTEMGYREDVYLPWTEEMLAELHRLFPRNLAVQSLGDFNFDHGMEVYRHMSLLPGNDVALIHLYAQPGSEWAFANEPMDVLMAEAVRKVKGFHPGRPILMGECGIVNLQWSGSEMYAKDKAGMMLHDMLFAPFFAGAAGPGHVFRMNLYVAGNELWYHYDRFRALMREIDPPAEGFEPSMLAHRRLRVYQLKGRRTLLLWCRDPQNTWKTEVADGQAPGTVSGETLDLGGLKARRVRIYDPWQDRWSDGALQNGKLPLPAFSRSIAVRIERKG